MCVDEVELVGIDDDFVYEENVEEEFDEDRVWLDLCCQVVKFLLCVREDVKIIQRVLDMVKDLIKVLFGEYLDVVKKLLIVKLKDSIGYDFEFFQDMDDLFVVDNVFIGLDIVRIEIFLFGKF